MQINEKILEALPEQEQVQVHHYAESLERSGVLNEDQIAKAISNYANGLVTYRQSMFESQGKVTRRRASSKARKAS